MDYLNSLAFNLRQRRLPEDRVAAVVAEVAEVARETGRPPADEFGRASRYAQEFPRGTKRSTGSRLLLGSVLVAGLVLLANIVLDLTAGWSFTALADPVPFSVYVAAFLLVATLVGIALDHRLPERVGTRPRE